MSNPCIKPIEAGSSPYIKRDSPITSGDSPYTKSESPISRIDSPLGERCLDYVIKVFENGSPFVFQNGDQYLFN